MFFIVSRAPFCEWGIVETHSSSLSFCDCSCAVIQNAWTIKHSHSDGAQWEEEEKNGDENWCNTDRASKWGHLFRTCFLYSLISVEFCVFIVLHCVRLSSENEMDGKKQKNKNMGTHANGSFRFSAHNRWQQSAQYGYLVCGDTFNQSENNIKRRWGKRGKADNKRNSLK